MNVENSKKAIQAAVDFFKLVVDCEDIRLEAIEMVEKDYKITLSYREKETYIFAEHKRHYNTFMINDKFELISMGMEKDCD